jgi:hypothetical protein
MAVDHKECSGECRGIICNGICFFLNNSLSNTKLIPEKDRYKYALGEALVTNLIGEGMKKF